MFGKIAISAGGFAGKETFMASHLGLTKEDLIFDTPEDAQNVLIEMKKLLDTYASVSVGMFYDLIGSKKQRTFFQDTWGWQDLSDSAVLGTTLILPDVDYIKEN